MMKGEIFQIDNPKTKIIGRGSDKRTLTFTRIKIKPLDYPKIHQIFFVDIVTGFRNATRWLPIIRSGLGTIIGSLQLKDDKHIDGDSYPVILRRPK